MCLRFFVTVIYRRAVKLLNDGCLTANDGLLRKMMDDLRSNDAFAKANIPEGLRPYPLL